MANLLVDTDVFVAHLRGERELSRGNRAIAYSAITRAELFAGRGAEEDSVTGLLAPFRELIVDREIAEAAGRIRCDTGVAMPDALIAATALTHGLEVLTGNRRNFERVSGLRLSDALQS